MEKNKVIPPNWIKTKVGNFSEIIMGQAPPGNTYNDKGKGTVFVKVGEFGKIYPKEIVWTTKPLRSSKKNDVLICVVGATIGKINLGIDCAIGRSVAAIRPVQNVLNFIFLYYYFTSLSEKIRSNQQGSAQGVISRSFLENLEVPLPPLSEQKRIVSKIEELFSKLEFTINNLNRIKLQLRQYGQSLLYSAVLGKLSKKWRDIHESELESSSILLEFILKNRHEKWEQIKKDQFKQNNKIPTNSDWKKKYNEPLVPDSNLPDLPKLWTWVTLDQVTWSVKDGPHYSPEYSNEGIPFITGGNVRPDGIDFVNAKRITPKLHDELSKRCKPEKNDILYTKGGTTGIARVNTYDHEFNVWVHVAVLKLVNPILPFYIQHALNSPFCYAQAQQYTHGVGNQDLGLTRMIKIIFGLPPIKEQKYIIALIDQHLSEANEIKKIVDLLSIYANKARHSILKQAFEGKLVPQDPNDEPASELLKKIKITVKN